MMQVRLHKLDLVTTVAIGGIIYPNHVLDPKLSSELPRWALVTTTSRRAVTTLALAIELNLPPPAAGLLGLLQVSAQLHTAAAAAGWVHYDLRLSRLPLEAYHIRPGHFSLAPMASGAPRPLGRDRFEAAMLQAVHLFGKPGGFVDVAVGKPTARLLRVKVGELLAADADEASLKLNDLLIECALPAGWVCSAHVCTATPAKLKAAGLASQPAADVTGVGVCEAIAAWSDQQLAALGGALALGRNIWCLSNGGTSQPKLDATATLASLRSLSAKPTAMLLLLTREPQRRRHAMLGGAGAVAERRATAKTVSALTVLPLACEYRWQLDPSEVATRVNARRTLLEAANPSIYEPSIIEPLPTVVADTCSLAGMLKVLLSYAELFALPHEQIYKLMRRGFDSGVLFMEGDQMTDKRVAGVVRKLSLSLQETVDRLDGLPERDPRRRPLLADLEEIVPSYQIASLWSRKKGDFHMHWHSGRALKPIIFPALGLDVVITLFHITGIDDAITAFAPFNDFTKHLVLPALKISLLQDMVTNGRYPDMEAVVPVTQEYASSELVLSELFAYLDEKATCGDAVTAAQAAGMRALHEWIQNETSMGEGDKEWKDTCNSPMFMPIHRLAGKPNEAALCAEQAVEVFAQSEYLYSAGVDMFTHRLRQLESKVKELKREVHKKPTDWINERFVDFLKRSLAGFSAMAEGTAERRAQCLLYLQGAHDVVTRLLGSRAGLDDSDAVPSASFDDVLTLATFLGPDGANVWAANPARKHLINAMAFAHYRATWKLRGSQLRNVMFTYNKLFALPEFANATASTPADAARSIATTASSEAAGAMIELAFGADGRQLASGFGRLPTNGTVLVSLAGHELRPTSPPVPSRFSFDEMIRHWGLTQPPVAETVVLITHCDTDLHSVSGSRLAPMRDAIKTAAPPLAPSASAVKDRLVQRLLSSIKIVELEYTTKMTQKNEASSKKKSHHEGLSLVKVQRLTSEPWLCSSADEYVSRKNGVRDKLAATEIRADEAEASIKRFNSGELSRGVPQQATLSDEQQRFQGQWDELLLLETHADLLRNKFVNAHRKVASEDVLRELGRAALQAQHLAHSASLKLQDAAQSGVVGQFSTDDALESMEASGFDSSASIPQLLDKIRLGARSAEQSRVSLSTKVRTSKKLELSGAQVKSISARQQGAAARASLARNREVRATSHPSYPAGSIDHHRAVPDGATGKALVGMAVTYQRRDGDLESWSSGVIERFDAKTHLYRVKFEGGAKGSKPASVKLCPRLRFYLPPADGAAAPPPLQLSELDARATLQLLEAEQAKLPQATTAMQALAVQLEPLTAGEQVSVREALVDPPLNVTDAPETTGDDATQPTQPTQPAALPLGSLVWYTRRLGAPPERATVVDVAPPSYVIEICKGIQRRAERGQLASLTVMEWESEKLRVGLCSDFVTRRDLRFLRPPPLNAAGVMKRLTISDQKRYWLNTQLVNAIGGLINTTFSHIRVFDTALMQVMLRADAKVTQPQVKVKLEALLSNFVSCAELFTDGDGDNSRALWAFPFNLSDQHWGLVVLHFGARLVVTADSMNGEKEQRHDEAARAAQIITQELFRMRGRAGAIQWASWRYRSLSNATVQQDDSINCGVYMLVLLWCLARGVPLCNVCAVDWPRWRMRLALWAVRGALPG